MKDRKFSRSLPQIGSDFFRYRVVIVALVLALCIGAVIGCSDSDLTKAAKAADDISAALGALETVNEQIYGSKLISGDESIAVSNYVQSATLANDQFIANVRSLKKIDSTNKSQVVAWFGALANSLQTLNQQAVLGVKNPQAQTQLASAFGVVQAAADVIAQMLNYQAPATKSFLPGYHPSEFPPAGNPTQPLWAMAIDVTTLEELIALALQVFGVGSKVVETIRAESGLSDNQLLDDAFSKDQATRDGIAAHIAKVNADKAAAPSSTPSAS